MNKFRTILVNFPQKVPCICGRGPIISDSDVKRESRTPYVNEKGRGVRWNITSVLYRYMSLDLSLLRYVN